MSRPLVDRVMEFIVQHDSEFRAGRVMVDGAEESFSAWYINLTLSENYYDINEALQRLAENPNNHIALLWRSNWNPDVIYSGDVARIDSLVLEFIRNNEFDVIMESPGFDAAFIAEKLGLNQNFVTCALQRLVKDPKNFLGLTNATSTNPAPTRDYGVSRNSKYAAAVG